MKKLWVTLIFCISIFATQANFAAENEHAESDKSASFEEKKSKERNKHANDGQRNHKHRDGHTKREWQAGTTLPEQYRQNDNQIDYSQHSRLSPPTKYQQWRKVNNQYVLMNVITNTIIKVVPE